MVVEAISCLTGFPPEVVLQDLALICGGEILPRMDERWGATSKLFWQRVTEQPDQSWDGAQLLGYTVKDASTYEQEIKRAGISLTAS